MEWTDSNTKQEILKIYELFNIYKSTQDPSMAAAQDYNMFSNPFWTSVMAADGQQQVAPDASTQRIPKEWQKANEALQEVQQTQTVKSEPSASSSSRAANQQSSTVNYPPYQYWSQFYAYNQGYQNYMPNLGYCQMAYRNGYNPYLYGMSTVPATSQSSAMSRTPMEASSSSGASLHASSSTTTAAAVKLLASQPPPPPPTTPPASASEDGNTYMPRNKQAPGAGGIRFSMPKRTTQKGNSLLDFNNRKKKRKGENSGQQNFSYGAYQGSPDPDECVDIKPNRESAYNFGLDFPESVRFPPTLKKYITESFAKCKTQLDKDQVEIVLKGKLSKALRDKMIWKKDWAMEPLPRIHSEQGQKEEETGSGSKVDNDIASRMPSVSRHFVMKQKGSYHKPPSRARQWSPVSRSRSRSLSRTRSRSRSRSPRRIIRRRKRFSSSSSSNSSCSNSGSHSSHKKQSVSSSIVGPEPRSSGGGGGKLWNSARSANKKKKNKKKGNKVQQFTVDSEFSSNDRLQRRAARFDVSGKKSGSLVLTINNPAVVLDDVTDIDWSSYAIAGTCEDIEKPFLRITSAVDPSTIRPEEVLAKSLQMVKDHWVQNQDYHYACEQLKSIRQDLVVQCIRNSFTVQAYETHARIALEKGDHTEFNQCQSQLKVLYEEVKDGNKQEFLGYRILYNVYTNDTREIKNILAMLSCEDKEDEVISHALNVNLAWTLSNFHVFFKLYVAAPKMSGFILDWFIPRVRKSAMKACLKSFRPTLPVSYVQSQFSFGTTQEALTFLEEVKCVLSDDKSCILCKESATSFIL